MPAPHADRAQWGNQEVDVVSAHEELLLQQPLLQQQQFGGAIPQPQDEATHYDATHDMDDSMEGTFDFDALDRQDDAAHRNLREELTLTGAHVPEVHAAHEELRRQQHLAALIASGAVVSGTTHGLIATQGVSSEIAEQLILEQ